MTSAIDQAIARATALAAQYGGSSAPAQHETHFWNVPSNLLHDVSDAAIGGFSGLLGIGGSALHDAGHAVGLVKGGYQLPKLGSQVIHQLAQDYQHVYAPLFHGDWRTTLKRIEEHPLGPILDVASIVTLGGSLAAKAGIKTAQYAGDAGLALKGARTAGLHEIAPAGVLSADNVGAIAGHIRAQGGRVNRTTGQVFLPKVLKTETRTSKELRLAGDHARADAAMLPVIAKRNPVLRGRQMAFEKLSAARPSAKIIGSEGRMARTLKKDANLELLRNNLQVAAPLYKAVGKGLDVHHEAAVHAIGQGITLDEYANHLHAQAAHLAKVSHVDEAGASLEHRALRHEQRALGKGLHKMLDKHGNPVGNIKTWQAKAGTILDKAAMKLDARVPKLEKDLAAAERKGDPHAVESVKRDIGAVKVARERLDKLAGQADHVSIVNHLDNLETDLHAAHNAPGLIASATQIAATMLHENTKAAHADISAGGITKAGQQAAKVLEAERRISDEHTRLLKGHSTQEAVQRASLAKRIASPDEFQKSPARIAKDRQIADAMVAELKAAPNAAIADKRWREIQSMTTQLYDTTDWHKVADWVTTNKPNIVPHVTRSAEKSGQGIRNAAQGSEAKFKIAAKPPATRHNTGWNFRFGMQSMDPKVIADSYRQSVAYYQSVGNFQKLLSMSRTVTNHEPIPKGWVSLDSAAFRRHSDAILGFLHEDAKVIFGESPELERVTHMFDEWLSNGKFGTDSHVIVPEGVHRELIGQFEKANEFIRRFIDQPTALWRHFTLNLSGGRWVTNNIIGQMFLLLATHGLYGSLRSLVWDQMIHRRGGIVDEVAPQIAQTGHMHFENSMANASLGSEIMRKARKPGDVIGKFNQYVSDDIPRRAAFLAEIRPAVKEMQRAFPDMTFEEAVRELGKHPRALDYMAQKVIGDLVNFHDLSETERRVMRRIMPFYSWTKGINKRTMQLVMDEPAKANAYAKLGDAYLAQNEQNFGGPLPDFLRGALGIGKANKKGIKSILQTTGVNPFGTVADTADQANSLISSGNPLKKWGPANPLAPVNPLIKSPLEVLMNRDTFYGGELVRKTPDNPTGSEPYGVTLAKRYFTAFPQVTYYKQFQQARHPALGYTPLYEPSYTAFLLRFAGTPLRRLDVQQALARGQQENPGLQ